MELLNSASRPLTVYSIWPTFACFAMLMLLAAIPVMRVAGPPTHPKGVRISSLDGLRGFLALSVFFHHAAISHVYWLSGQWAPPPSRFYQFLGQAGVSMFFMITAFLFWTKLLKEKGNPNWTKLYVGRIFRVGPVYCLAIGWMLLLVALKTDFRLREPLSNVLAEVARWLLFGTFLPLDINHYPATSDLLAGVTWSLHYEWLFYVSLPVTAVAIRRKIDDLLLTGVALLAVTIHLVLHPDLSVRSPYFIYIEFFLLGMTCASLEKRRWNAKLPQWLSSVLIVILVGTVFLEFKSANLACPALLLGTVFFLIISGSDLFGLLTSAPARRLGDVSYGIYLLQGLVLTCALSVHTIRIFFLASPIHHWLTVFAASVLLLAASTAAHVYVEKPGIELGKRVAGALGSVAKRNFPLS